MGFECDVVADVAMSRLSVCRVICSLSKPNLKHKTKKIGSRLLIFYVDRGNKTIYIDLGKKRRTMS